MHRTVRHGRHAALLRRVGAITPHAVDSAFPDGVADISAALGSGATTSLQVTRALLERIERLDPAVGAFVGVDAERALARAQALDVERRAGHCRGPLHGVPVAYKDLCFIGGLPNTCGTAMREYFTAEADCTVARRLTRAGAITLGKLACTELAMGTFGINEAQGTPTNPWAPARVPGGSSSGSAVAVAAGLVPAAVGTDTGGSIRIPAACCGIAGLKPTYGLVGRSGIMPVSHSLDHVGPMARRVRDVAALLSAMAGFDAGDAASVRRPASDDLALRDVRGLRIGVAAGDYFADVSAEIATAMEQAQRVLREVGMRVEPVTLPDPRPMMEATATIVRAESAAAHGHRLAGGDAEFQPLVRARLEEGLRVTAAAYLHALAAVARLRQRFVREVFASVDCVLAPVLPERPPLLLEATGPPEQVAGRMARFAKFARLFNGLGIPVLSLPCGYTTDGLPLGMQLAGPPFEEATVLAIGAAYEDSQQWFARRPSLGGRAG